jgi:hypothetical protein
VDGGEFHRENSRKKKSPLADDDKRAGSRTISGAINRTNRYKIHNCHRC